MAATGWGDQLALGLHPSDRTVLALLTLALAVALACWPSVGSPLTPLVEVQGGLLAGFLACSILMTIREQSGWVIGLRPLATVAVIFVLYTTLGRLGVTAMPYRLDATLAATDRAFLRFDPSLALERFRTPALVEFFSFVYASFIPYIYFSLFLGCLGRRPLERDQFLTGWVFTYAISYLGYIFLPAHGPVVYQADQYRISLEGGFFYRLVVEGNELTGGLQGAFPSLHVGGSVYLCLFDLRTNRIRGLTYLPIVLMIFGATLMLRYHYVVDLVAGTAIAVACNPLGERVFLAWARRRRGAEWPALPGGEGDDLPIFSDAVPTGVALVLPPH